MTEPLEYASPAIRAKTPLIAWVSIVLAAFAFIVDLFGVAVVRYTAVVFTNTGGAGVVMGSGPPPIWTGLFLGLAIGLPLIGLILAIIAMRRANANKGAAIVGIVLNALMLCVLLLTA